MLIFKLSFVFAGLFCIYLGYKLFCKGVYESAGSFKGEYKIFKIVIQEGAPGTFFVILGIVLLIFSIFKGMRFSDNSTFKTIPTESIIDSSNEKLQNENDKFDLPKTSPL